jgi:hypothetical protein
MLRHAVPIRFDRLADAGRNRLGDPASITRDDEIGRREAETSSAALEPLGTKRAFGG